MTQLTPELSTIVTAVSSVFEIPPHEILGRSKHADIVDARFALVWVARKVMHLSYPRLGKYLGRNHTALIWANNSAMARIDTDIDYKSKCLSLLNRVVEERTNPHFWPTI